MAMVIGYVAGRVWMSQKYYWVSYNTITNWEATIISYGYVIIYCIGYISLNMIKNPIVRNILITTWYFPWLIILYETHTTNQDGCDVLNFFVCIQIHYEYINIKFGLIPSQLGASY